MIGYIYFLSDLMCLIRPDINLSRTPGDCCRVNQETFVKNLHNFISPHNATAPGGPGPPH